MNATQKFPTTSYKSAAEKLHAAAAITGLQQQFQASLGMTKSATSRQYAGTAMQKLAAAHLITVAPELMGMEKVAWEAALEGGAALGKGLLRPLARWGGNAIRGIGSLFGRGAAGAASRLPEEMPGGIMSGFRNGAMSGGTGEPGSILEEFRRAQQPIPAGVHTLGPEIAPGPAAAAQAGAAPVGAASEAAGATAAPAGEAAAAAPGAAQGAAQAAGRHWYDVAGNTKDWWGNTSRPMSEEGFFGGMGKMINRNVTNPWARRGLRTAGYLGREFGNPLSFMSVSGMNPLASLPGTAGSIYGYVPNQFREEGANTALTDVRDQLGQQLGNQDFMTRLGYLFSPEQFAQGAMSKIPGSVDEARQMGYM